MASYSVPTNRRGVHAKTLAANTVDTVTFADDLGQVEVVSDGSAAIYVAMDGATPSVAGQNTDVLPAGVIGSRVIPSAAIGPTVVRLISDGTPTYSVTGA